MGSECQVSGLSSDVISGNRTSVKRAVVSLVSGLLVVLVAEFEVSDGDSRTRCSEAKDCERMARQGFRE